MNQNLAGHKTRNLNTVDVPSAQPAPWYIPDHKPIVAAPWSETSMKDLSAVSTAHSTPSLATLVPTVNYSAPGCRIAKAADPHDANV